MSPESQPTGTVMPPIAAEQRAARHAARLPRLLRWIAVIAVLGGIVVALRLTVLQPAPVPVTAFRVATGRVEETVTTSRAGTITARQQANLGPEIGGRVERLQARKGDAVRRGDILLVLADADHRTQVALAQSAHEAAIAAENEICRNAVLAAQELGRTRELAEQALVSRQALDQAAARRDAADAACTAAAARVRQAEGSIQVARVALAKTVLRAPFDGIVVEVTTEVGEWITPAPPGLAMPAVIRLMSADALYVSAQLDEIDLGRVTPGLPARITLDAYPGEAFAGRLTRVGAFVSDIREQNRTFEVEIEFDDAEVARRLLPGTSADVEVILQGRDDILRIPTYALMQGNRVLVLRDGILVEVSVGTGLANWEFTEVTEGLSSGDLVVVSLDRIEVQPGVRAHLESETLR